MRHDIFPDRAFEGPQPLRPDSAGGFPIDTLEAVIDLLHPYFHNRREEVLRSIFLNEAGKLQGMAAWSGGPDRVELPVRRIIASALAADANGIILAHNHPSGDPLPSREDVRTTRDFVQVCRKLGLVLLDHVIITADQVTSFRAMKLI